MASFLTEWRPFAAPTLLNRSSLWDDMVRDFFGPPAETPRPDLVRFNPRASVHETAESYVVRVDLPGVKPEDVSVTVAGDTLTIAGKKHAEDRKEGQTYHILERAWGVFERTFSFPAPVEGDAVQAESHDGVLEVRVAKAKETQPRKIEIKTRAKQAEAPAQPTQ